MVMQRRAPIQINNHLLDVENERDPLAGIEAIAGGTLNSRVLIPLRHASMVRFEYGDIVEQCAHLKVLLSGNLGRKNTALTNMTKPTKRMPPMIMFDSKSQLQKA